jgi:hypothetical protein
MKLGRMEFKVVEVKTDEKFEMLKQEETNLDEIYNEIHIADEDKQCRICFSR